MCTIEVENQRQGVAFYPVCVYCRSRVSASGSRVLLCVFTLEVENQRRESRFTLCVYNRSRESASGSRVLPCVYNRSRESASGSRVLPCVCTIEVENQRQGVALYPVCVQ